MENQGFSWQLFDSTENRLLSDAQMIADFCRMHNPDAWIPKSPEIKELHEINRRIDSLKIEQNRTSNILEKQNLQ